MADVLITGDSHTAALRRGQLAVEARGAWPDDIRLKVWPLGGGHLACDPFFADRGDHAEITLPEYRRQFERLPRADDPPEMVYGLSAPLHSVRLWRNADWQTFRPAATSGSGTPISSGMIERLALEDQRHNLDLLAVLKRIGRNVFVVEPPPPFRHHPALRKTPAQIVLDLDRIFRTTIRRELARLSVPVVAVPDHCLDDGFTHLDYALPGDPHHGNALYGQVMMEEVLAFLRRDAAAPAIAA